MVEKQNTNKVSRRRSSVNTGNRLSRHESITRGTASSIAKMVRPLDQEQQQPLNQHQHHHHNNNKTKKKRNSIITSSLKKQTKSNQQQQQNVVEEEQEDPRRKSWCPTTSTTTTTKKRVGSSRLSPNNSDSHNVNASNHRLQYKRDSIDSLTTSTTVSSHEEDYIPKPSRSVKPFSKPFKQNGPSDCKQKNDLILEEQKHNEYPNDLHASIPHYMTKPVREPCNQCRKPSLSKTTSLSDDDLPRTPSPCCSPIPHEILAPDYRIEEMKTPIPEGIPIIKSKPALIHHFEKKDELKIPLSEPTIYANTTLMHPPSDDLCTHLSQQLWNDLNEKGNSKWTRLKWNLGQWMGTLVGTGEVQGKDYDNYGHPNNITISGLCVTTEPGLLPKKSGQKKEWVSYSYLLELSRQKRLGEFQMMNKNRWVPDTQVSTCEFAGTCTNEFGIFNRKHHCRSCGHIFCQSHSANRLPLFRPDDTGEWVRVCDSCLSSRVKPSLLKRVNH